MLRQAGVDDGGAVEGVGALHRPDGARLASHSPAGAASPGFRHCSLVMTSGHLHSRPVTLHYSFALEAFHYFFSKALWATSGVLPGNLLALQRLAGCFRVSKRGGGRMKN